MQCGVRLRTKPTTGPRRTKAKRLTVAFALLAAGSTAPLVAQPTAEPSRRLCIDEVCIGDDVVTLDGIRWDEVMHPSTKLPLADATLSPDARRLVARQLRGDPAALDAVGPYWIVGTFGPAGMRALASVTHVCDSLTVAGRMRASFSDRQGNQVTVRFAPVIGPDQRHRFEVESISETFGEVDPSSQRALERELHEQYGAYPPYASRDSAAVQISRSIDHRVVLKLMAAFGDPIKEARDLRSQPGCSP